MGAQRPMTHRAGCTRRRWSMPPALQSASDPHGRRKSSRIARRTSHIFIVDSGKLKGGLIWRLSAIGSVPSHRLVPLDRVLRMEVLRFAPRADESVGCTALAEG